MDEDLTRLRRATEHGPDDAAAWLRLAQAQARAGAHQDALEAARRALALEPALDDARALARRAYVEVTAAVEPPGLREAIGRALGRGGPWTAPAGWDEAHLLGGSVHAASGAVAWVDELRRESPTTGHVDRRVTLHGARGGRELLTWSMAHGDPDASATVHHVHVDPERVTLVYRDEHRELAAVVPLEGAPAVLELEPPFLVLADQVVSGSQDRGVLEVRRLPDLAPRLPLSTPGPPDVFHDRPLRLDGASLVVVSPPPARGARPIEHVLRLPPGPPEPLLDLAEARALALGGPLAGAPQPEADLLLGATCHPFWLDTRQATTGAPPGGLRWNSPGWLPLYWHRELVRADRDHEAASLVALLDRLVATDAPTGPSPGERLTRHLAGRAAELRGALRAGHLPPGVLCQMWARWSVEAFTPWLASFPPGFVEVFRALRAVSPRPLTTYHDVQGADEDRGLFGA